MPFPNLHVVPKMQRCHFKCAHVQTWWTVYFLYVKLLSNQCLVKGISSRIDAPSFTQRKSNIKVYIIKHCKIHLINDLSCIN